MIPANGSQVTVAQVISSQLEDGTNKPLNFKVEKGTSTPSFIARGKDGNLYSVSLEGALVTVNVAPKPDLEADRKAGRPIPRDKAKEVDERIKKKKERAEKVASGEMSAEDAAKEAAKEQKEAERAEAEEDEAADEEAKKESAQSTLTGGSGKRAR